MIWYITILGTDLSVTLFFDACGKLNNVDMEVAV